MADDTPPLPTPEQVRALRGWLRQTQGEFAEAIGVPKRTLVRYELGDTAHYGETLGMLRDAFARTGAEFLFEGGVAVGIKVPRPRRVPRKMKRGSRVPEDEKDGNAGQGA